MINVKPDTRIQKLRRRLDGVAAENSDWRDRVAIIVTRSELCDLESNLGRYANVTHDGAAQPYYSGFRLHIIDDPADEGS